MGPVLVVVGYEHIKNTLEVLLVQNEQRRANRARAARI